MDKILDFFFHKHTYDSTAWEEVGRTNSYYEPTDMFGYSTRIFAEENPEPTAIYVTYKNTCLTCGDLADRTIKI